MSEKYQRPDHIRVVKVGCVELGNNDDFWAWCYFDVREALTKAKDLLMRLEQEKHLVCIGYFSPKISHIYKQ